MRVFIDVGANIGQTLEEATKPEWGFEKWWAFEPMPREFRTLSALYGSRPGMNLRRAGLASETGRLKVYGTNDKIEASIYPDKNDVDESVFTECRMLGAAEFFSKFIAADDVNVMKLNCEGAEVPILDDLADSGEIHKLDRVMIDFDIRKVPGREPEADRILGKLRAVGFSAFDLCENVMNGPTHQARIANWLQRCR